MLVTLEDERVVSVAGDPDHPFTDGFLCHKVSRLPERIHHAERLLYPMRRTGPKGSGQFERITWHEARLSGPSNDKALHRFHFDVDWDGSEMILQSRAVDSTGYVQPTKDQLRAFRGENSIYHNNGIQTWLVTPDGKVENVEIS